MEAPVTGSDVGEVEGDHEVCNEGENVGDDILAIIIIV